MNPRPRGVATCSKSINIFWKQKMRLGPGLLSLNPTSCCPSEEKVLGLLETPSFPKRTCVCRWPSAKTRFHFLPASAVRGAVSNWEESKVTVFKSEHFVNGFISISLTIQQIIYWSSAETGTEVGGCQKEESVHLCLLWRCLQLSVGQTCRLYGYNAYNSMVTTCGARGERVLPLWTGEHGLRMGKELFTGSWLVDQDFLRSVVWRRPSWWGSSMVSTGQRKAQPKSWELLCFFLLLLFFKLLFLFFKF